MVHNRLVKMWVLTYSGEGQHDYLQVMADVAAFIRRLRRNLFRGKPIPYLFAAELHPSGHGWHVNLMLQNVFIDKRQMDRLWGHGNVWYTDFTKDKTDWLGRRTGRRPGRGGSTGRAAARVAASYAAKYIVKQMDEDDRPRGVHRYEVAEGFQPQVVTRRLPTFNDALRWVKDHPSFGTPTYAWRSNDEPEGAWFGPPCEVVWFDAKPNPSRKRDRRRRDAASSSPRSSISWGTPDPPPAPA